ncbi:MAG: GNAT family N-acetyltransferase [Alphaproteobacteria bacterium]|nr:GNAT family N-acetyltransferase [Alphaproteobacteria bacterium]
MSIKVQDFEVRLAKDESERRRVRQLRYDVYIRENDGIPTPEMAALKEEFDSFDEHAKYMVVLHKDEIIGCYRIIDREIAAKTGFYTETEYDISKIKAVKGNIAEMSRALVREDYRDTFAMQMLWLGLGDYIRREKVIVLFGLGSFGGIDPNAHADQISYLYHKFLSPENLRATVRADLMDPSVDKALTKMDMLPMDKIDEEEVKKNLPALIKGYLRVNATFGDGVFIDVPCNLSDIFLIVESSKISPAYQKRFGGAPDAFANLKTEF